METGLTFVERTKKIFVNMRGSAVGFTNPIKCANPFLLIFDTPFSNIISISLDTVNISGAFNPDDRSVVIYIPECQNVFEWYSSNNPRVLSISPFAVVPITKYKYARWLHDPFVKLFEYPIPYLQYLTIYLLNLDNELDTRVSYAELWFTIKYLSPVSQ